jgi:signal transduction histidine kinase
MMMAAHKVVMVVDDDDALRDSLCDLLEEDGYRTVSASDGASALERLRKSPSRPDLILLDLVMGGVNGWQFRRAQLADPLLSNIPVVVLSAGREVRSVEADAVVTKPIDLGSLLALVRRHTGGAPPPPRRPGGGVPPPARGIPAEGSDAGRLVRSLDWSTTPLGPVAAWPQSLRTAVDISLSSKSAIWLAWGPELTFIYNDAYRPILKARHPWGLGRPMQEVWPEIWNIMGPMVRGGMERAEATWHDDQMLILERAGFPEESYFTYSCGPVRDESDAVTGVFTTVFETTASVLGVRRLRCLRELGALPPASTVDRACTEAMAVLERHTADLPFAAIYVVDQAHAVARLAGSTVMERSSAAIPEHVSLLEDGDPWGLKEVAASRVARQVDLSGGASSYPGGPWPEPARAALVLPIAHGASEGLVGLLITGISPRLEFDDDYRAFLELVSTHVEAVLARARLIQDERRRTDQLAALDRAKTEFFSNVSHELRTPLTLLLAPLADYLRENSHAASDVQVARVGLAHANALRLLKLVNALLEFSRIQAGRIEAEYEPLDLGRLTTDIAAFFWSASQRAGLEYVIDCPTVPEPVYVDREMWEKVVLNLISNAFKFTFEGSIRVVLAPVDGGVELAVSDTGVGIPLPDQSRVFDRFHQVRGSRSRTHEGTGIGLALVSELVKLHGGSVSLDSAVDAGSTFKVTLPYGSAHLPQDQVRTRGTASQPVQEAEAFVQEALAWLPDGVAATGGSPPLAGQASPDDPRARVVVIDDNRDMRRYISDLLAVHWRVTTYSDGEQALTGIASSPPDLVVSDVMMPGVDGFGLLARLRKDPPTAAIPVILVSAQAGEEARVQGLAAGAEDYLVKPFSGPELVARVGAHLALVSRRREAEHAARKVDAKVQDAERFRSVGKLAGGIAHEFNNLLTTVIGYTALCLDDPELTDSVRENLTEVQAAADRAALVTRQLLAYGQKQTLRPVRLEISTFLEEIAPRLARHAGESVTVKIDVPEGLPSVLADPAQIESALLHLVANARDAMAPGGVVTIEASETRLVERLTLDTGGLDLGPYVVVVVRDTGRGIDPAARSKMFEPFYSTKLGGPSQGLGLSVVLGVVRQSGGQIRVQSQAGEGTSIELFLPVAVPAPPAAAVAPAARTLARGVTVLVAEDEPTVRMFVTRVLKSAGYRVFEAPDGHSALDLADRIGPFELLVTDVVMPRMTGPELARALTERDPELQVLFMSGYSGDDVVRQGLVEHGAAFLQKPFSPHDFKARVAALLDSPGATPR